MKTTKTLGTSLAALAVAAAALVPAAASAGAPRLAVAGQKDDDTVILLDMASRRNAEGQIEADGVLVFPKALPAFQVQSATTAPSKLPDKGHITLRFDCKARTITLVRLTLFDADGQIIPKLDGKGQVIPDAPIEADPQAPVDPTDAHMLAYACGETFPPANETFSDEKVAITMVRAKP